MLQQFSILKLFLNFISTVFILILKYRKETEIEISEFIWTNIHIFITAKATYICATIQL